MELYNKRIRIVLAAALLCIALYLGFTLIFHGNASFSDIPEITAVNINTADIGELLKLKGVGEKTAQKIIDFRNENGSFEKPEDIMKVEGIGEAFFENNRKSIVV